VKPFAEVSTPFTFSVYAKLFMKNIKPVANPSLTVTPIIASDPQSTVTNKTRRRFTPSLSELIFIGCLLISLNIGEFFLEDDNTYWHILTGDTILKTWQIPSQDSYSYTAAGQSWIAQEWLAEVVFALFHKIGGLNGVVFLSTALVSLTFYFLYKFLLYRQINPLLGMILTVFAAVASQLHWLARPQLFSFLFLLGFLIILELFEHDELNYLKWLPLMMLVWVNLHASSIFGLALMVLYLGSAYARTIFQPAEPEAAQRKCKLLGRAFLLTLAATLVNPQGAKILFFPFQLTRMEAGMNSFLEWLLPNFHILKAAQLFAVLCVTILLLSKKRLSMIEAGLLALLLYMSLYPMRYLSLMAILITPLVAIRAQDLLQEVAGHLSKRNFMQRWKRGGETLPRQVHLHEAQRKGSHWIYVTLALCFIHSWTITQTMGLSLRDCKINPELFPVDAIQFAHQNQLSGKLFNQDFWGGYILQEIYPKGKIFFDGRTGMYGNESAKEYLQVARAEKGFEKILDKYEVNWVLYETQTPLCRALRAGDNWKRVYSDGVANIFLRNVPENRELIEKFSITHDIPKGYMPVGILPGKP
jgi:hypothetical protein